MWRFQRDTYTLPGFLRKISNCQDIQLLENVQVMTVGQVLLRGDHKPERILFVYAITIFRK